MRTLLLHTLAAGVFPLLMTACATSAAAGAGASRTVADGDSFTLAFGERVSLADRGTLRYVRVANDSRCPPGKQCVWAGDAEVEFEWTATAGSPEAFTLHTGRGDRSRTLAGRVLTLDTLERGASPAATLTIAAAGAATP